MLKWEKSWPEQSADFPKPILESGEMNTYRLSGYVWRLVIEDNDDDIHLEINADPKNMASPRIIAEIPCDSEYASDRAILMTAFLNEQRKEGKRTTSARCRQSYNLTIPIPITLSGYKFFDRAHASKDWKSSHGHGTNYVKTLWELHPAGQVSVRALPASMSRSMRPNPESKSKKSKSAE